MSPNEATKTLSHWEGSEWQVVRMAYEVVFIGGPSGVGKSSVDLEMHAQLSAADFSHWRHSTVTFAGHKLDAC